ncbi:Non-canonical purine NTP pyrophosphatase [compost metagenome]
MIVYLATTNAHKLAEFQPLLLGAPFTLEAMPEAVEVEETGSTFVENARLKARTCAQRFQVPCLADDSGIAVEALDGRPGIASARYAASDAERIAKLLGELADKANRAATFHCAVVLAYPDGREVAVEGIVKGRVTEDPRGNGGFGYDPVFEVDGLGKTYAELSADEKNTHSHRARAVRLLLEALA